MIHQEIESRESEEASVFKQSWLNGLITCMLLYLGSG